jgi:hypothetical protein
MPNRIQTFEAVEVSGDPGGFHLMKLGDETGDILEARWLHKWTCNVQLHPVAGRDEHGFGRREPFSKRLQRMLDAVRREGDSLADLHGGGSMIAADDEGSH